MGFLGRRAIDIDHTIDSLGFSRSVADIHPKASSLVTNSIGDLGLISPATVRPRL